MLKTLPALLFGALVVLVFASVPWTSLDFQECIKSYGENNPPHSTYRHCVGAYVTDKNAVITALGTLVIAVFTTVLGVFTISLARSTRIAADAPKLNAQAVIDAERAYLFVFVAGDVVPAMEQALQFNEGSPAKLRFTISYAFENYGRTPAIVREISHGACIAPDLPQERTYSPVLHLPTHILPVGKGTPSIPVDEAPTITAAIAKSIRDTENTFWFYGRITYDDMFGWRRTFNFVWHYSAVSEGFTLYSWAETQERRDS